MHFLSVCLSLCSELFYLSEKLSWVFYLSLLSLNFFPFSTFFLFLLLFRIISLAEEFSWIFYFSLFYLNFSPFLNILTFLPLFRIFSFHRNGLGYYFPPFWTFFLFSCSVLFFLSEKWSWIFTFLFSTVSKIFPFLNILSFSSSVFLPLFKIIFPFRENGLDILPFYVLSQLFPLSYHNFFFSFCSELFPL